MNGVTLGGGNTDDTAVAGFVDLLSGLTKVWKRIFEWAPQEAGRLAASVGWDSGRGAVPLVEWLERFPASCGASVDAFCRFVEYDLPEHPTLLPLKKTRVGFIAPAGGGR
jgi:hypothetical protein